MIRIETIFVSMETNSQLPSFLVMQRGICWKSWVSGRHRTMNSSGEVVDLDQRCEKKRRPPKFDLDAAMALEGQKINAFLVE